MFVKKYLKRIMFIHLLVKSADAIIIEMFKTGASLIGAPFIPHFAHFAQAPQRAFIAAPSTQRVTQTRPHHHSAHHPAIAAAAAFYQQSVYPVYWPYPSPPVSPTTYFSTPAAHSPGANGQHHVYPLDFIPANYGIAPTSPLGSLAAPAAGIVISNKTPLLQLAPPPPTTPKQFSIQTTAGSVTAVRHNGVVPIQTKTTTTTATNTLQSAIKGVEGGVVKPAVKPLSATPPSLALLAINTCDQLIKTTSPSATTTATSAATSMDNNNAPSAQIVPQNQCVELFIS